MNRNHYFMLGTVLLLLGITIFKVDNLTLTEQSTRFIAQQTGAVPEGGVLDAAPVPKKTIAIPPWLRFSLISVGAILMLHAMGMSKPGG